MQQNIGIVESESAAHAEMYVSRIPEIVTGMVQRRKTMGLHLYQGTAHGFHNDTSPIYNPGAAADAWSKTLAFFNTHLNA